MQIDEHHQCDADYNQACRREHFASKGNGNGVSDGEADDDRFMKVKIFAQNLSKHLN